MADTGDEAERRRRARSDAARKRGRVGGSTAEAVKREPEEAVPDAPPRRGVIGPVDYLPPGQEELLERVVLERSTREQEEMEERIRRELEYERLFFETGVTASQAHKSKEVDLRVMKAEQAKLYIDLDSDSD
nr:uncharacterized protein LOC109787170 [Aegilops tauschii subsp. strangulata]